MGSSTGRHILVGPTIDEGAKLAMIIEEDGTVKAGTVGTERFRRKLDLPAGKGIPVEPCPAAEDGQIYHEVGRDRGPARVNSPRYCAGWERTFGSRN